MDFLFSTEFYNYATVYFRNIFSCFCDINFAQAGTSNSCYFPRVCFCLLSSHPRPKACHNFMDKVERTGWIDTEFYKEENIISINQNISGLIPWPLGVIIIMNSKEDHSSIHVQHVFWFDENRKRWSTASQLNLMCKKSLQSVKNISQNGFSIYHYLITEGWRFETQEIFYKLKIS